VSENSGIPLDNGEKKILQGFNAEILLAQKKTMDFLRDVVRKKGISAERLEYLKSESGEPFVEEKSGENRSHGSYRKAAVKKNLSGGLPVLEIESAYLCRPMDALSLKEKEDDTDSCGWVKGQPVEKNYDNIGHLSGSAGKRFFCRICGQQIGEIRLRIS
jgi:hypothetical protein